MFVRIFLLCLYDTPNMSGFEFITVETLKARRSLLGICLFEGVWVLHLLFMEIQLAGGDL